MTPQEMRDWRHDLWVTWDQAASMLGITTENMASYEAGVEEIPKTVENACHLILAQNQAAWEANQPAPIFASFHIAESADFATVTAVTYIPPTDRAEALSLLHEGLTKAKLASEWIQQHFPK